MSLRSINPPTGTVPAYTPVGANAGVQGDRIVAQRRTTGLEDLSAGLRLWSTGLGSIPIPHRPAAGSFSRTARRPSSLGCAEVGTRPVEPGELGVDVDGDGAEQADAVRLHRGDVGK
jgi:hypothetical protein